MAETLAQKAQRLGIKPAGVASVQKETLAQKAQRLGIKPAQPIAQPINPYNDTPILGPLSNVGIGIGTSIAKTGLGLGQLALKGVGALGNVMSKGTAERFTDPLVKNIEDIKQKVYTDPFKKELETKSGKTGQVIGEAATYLAPSSKITAGQKAITGLVSKIPAVTKTSQFGRGALGVAGRAVPEAVGAGASSLAITGGDTERAKRDALIGGGTSAVLGTVGSLYRGAKDTGIAKTVLSKTSGIPKSAFDAVGDGINKGATPEIALEKARGSVVGLRSKLTNEWQSAIPKIEEKFIGKVYSMPKEQLKKLVQVADEFGLDETVLPVNIKKITAPEAINLMKGLNELDSLAVKASPKGAIVRQFKKELKDNILNTFGGENGEVSQLWKNYSTKSQILQNMNDIVNTYKTTPRATVTAKNRLMAIFDENKPEFLKAVKDIEKEMGINLTKDIASTKFQNFLPAGILKADGGLPTKSGIVDKLIKALFLPVTSPKIVGKIALPVEREAGVLENRLFGDYNPKSPSKTIPASTQMPINSPKNVNPIKANIPTSSTIKKDLSNKQGGFISNTSSLNTKASLPKDALFLDAVKNTEGAEITKEGLKLKALRFQTPEQAGSQSVRTGVFYLPSEKSAGASHYKGKMGYGGSEKMTGDIVVQKPMFVKGATGGKAPEIAFDTIKGKGAYQKMRSEVLNSYGYNARSYEKEEAVQALLEKYNGLDSGDAYDLAYNIVENSKGGNTLPYAIQENIVAHTVRDAGYDSILGYSVSREKKPILSELFDLREISYPEGSGMAGDINPSFLGEAGKVLKSPLGIGAGALGVGALGSAQLNKKK